MTLTRGEDIGVGDLLHFLGRDHSITRIDPYVHPTMEGAFATAYSGQDFQITMWHGAWLDVTKAVLA